MRNYPAPRRQLWIGSGRLFYYLTAIVVLAFTGCTRGNSTGLNPGYLAPDFTLGNLTNGQELVSLHSFRGKVVILTFWASWCAPCLNEMTAFKKLASSFNQNELTIVAVGSDDSREKLIRVAQSQGLPFVLLYDESGEVKSRYEVTGFPETFVIKADGTLVLFPDPEAGPLVRIKGERDWSNPLYKEILSRYTMESKQ